MYLKLSQRKIHISRFKLMDKKSRSSVEMNDPASRPEIAKQVENMDMYDTVLVGFPIWWYVEPKIIDTFLDSYDFQVRQ